ncbi:spermidine synthase [Pseudomonas sp. HK3]
MLKSIHKTIDALGTIEVLDDGAKRYLTFGNEHEQSCQVKNEPHIPQHEYTRAIMLSLLFCQPKTVAVLGLGGGTLVYSFLNSCEQAHITAIELRADVVRIAHRYFALPKNETRLNIVNEDAASYMEEAQGCFDILVADLYHHNGIDDVQMQRDFLKNCAKRVSENGWFVLNYWLDHDLNSDILQQLHDDFNCIYTCNSGGGNLIIYAGKSYPLDDFLLPAHTKTLAKKLGFSLNYYIKRLKQITAV